MIGHLLGVILIFVNDILDTVCRKASRENPMVVESSGDLSVGGAISLRGNDELNLVMGVLRSTRHFDW